MVLAGIRFKTSVKVYFFDSNGLDLSIGDDVVAESERGLSLGRVVKEPAEMDPPQQEVKRLARKATPEDLASYQRNAADEPQVFRACQERIAAHNLPMKLVKAEYTLDRAKIVFYFTADGRIDFRDLVKDLARTFKSRIEMRQIGVRDASKICGALAMCGREVCCAGFLTGFKPISIKMIRTQGLPLNPAKLSGMCGRLMCCLAYEVKNYQAGGDLCTKGKGAYLKSLDEAGGEAALKRLDEKASDH